MFASKMSCLWVLVLVMLGCEDVSRRSPAAVEQTHATEKLAQEGNRQVGMPGVVNFTERRLLRELYELRDQDGLATHTYMVDLNGRLFHICDSIGYGMPFSAQFTTPERELRGYQSITTIGQPEPNGLFPPTSTSATWVICADPSGEPRPVYVEPQIIVSPFPLSGVFRSYAEWHQAEKE